MADIRKLGIPFSWSDDTHVSLVHRRQHCDRCHNILLRWQSIASRRPSWRTPSVYPRGSRGYMCDGMCERVDTDVSYAERDRRVRKNIC